MPSKRRGTTASYVVFISHAHAKQVSRLIQEAGKGRIRSFLDEKDIEGGQAIADSIREGIRGCDEFLVLMSRYSKDRPWVLVEIGAAWGLGKPIVAIIDKVSPKEMPDVSNPYKAIDLNDFDHM